MDAGHARALVDAAVERARSQQVAITVAVVDPAGHTVAKLRMDGAKLITLALAEDKAYSAAAIGMATKDLAPVVQPGGEFFGLTSAAGGRIVAFPGGLPVRGADDELLGAIGISGGSSEQDNEIATHALATAASAVADS